MTFRTRLSLFFVAMVVVPMFAVGVAMLKVVADAEAGKADARLSGAATVGVQIYKQALSEAKLKLRRVVADRPLLAAVKTRDPQAILSRERVLSSRLGLQRLAVGRGSSSIAVGDPQALALAAATLADGAHVEGSTLLPTTLVRTLTGNGVRAVVEEGGVIADTSLPPPPPPSLPAKGRVKIGGTTYRTAAFTASDGTGPPARIAVFIDDHDLAVSTGKGRRLAVAVLLGFLALASFLAMLISRALQGQIDTYLAAARRLGTGDFSTSVPVSGRDEFAQLGGEFNKMSRELEQRLRELREERARLEHSIRRSGETFAAKLDGATLLDLGLHTAVDAVRAHAGRASLRADGTLVQSAEVGDLSRHGEIIQMAEREALHTRAFAMTAAGDRQSLAMPLGLDENGRALGLLSVARSGEPFTPVERELFSSLAGQAAVSLENVALHEQVQRQAVTDELTGLANHREFQRAMDAELQRAARQGNEVALVMLDVDNFKRVNDTHGHPQGDEVLRAVARVLRDTSRIGVDTPARYGGEEMALILPETDVVGAYNVAERVREAIEALRFPLANGQGELRVTASLGVAAAATTGSAKVDVIAAADKALYEAKHTGKNRTMRGFVEPAAL